MSQPAESLTRPSLAGQRGMMAPRRDGIEMPPQQGQRMRMPVDEMEVARLDCERTGGIRQQFVVARAFEQCDADGA